MADPLIDAFIALGTGETLTTAHRAALLTHLKQTIPKSVRKAMRDQALVETIEQLHKTRLELFPRPHGAIDIAARQFKIGYSTAAQIWREYRQHKEDGMWNLFLKK